MQRLVPIRDARSVTKGLAIATAVEQVLFRPAALEQVGLYLMAQKSDDRGRNVRDQLLAVIARE